MTGLPDDYAVAGAATGHENSSVPMFGGVQDQIALYLSSQQGDPNALYILWAGHNDLCIALATGENPETMIRRGVINTLESVQTLWGAGARHIMVLNVADLGMTPAISQWGADFSASVSALCAAYNQALAAALQGLAASGTPTIRLDVFAGVRAIVNSPSEFGFTNVTDPFLLPDGTFAGDDPAQYYWWDDAHSTTRAHRLVADSARSCLIDYYSPRRGKGVPPALVNALNGLVQAGKGN
jgi:phospholipase/lecithinase/hemolysin